MKRLLDTDRKRIIKVRERERYLKRERKKQRISDRGRERYRCNQN